MIYTHNTIRFYHSLAFMAWEMATADQFNRLIFLLSQAEDVPETLKDELLRLYDNSL